MVIVESGSEEDLEHGLVLFVAVDVEVVGERLVVEAVTAALQAQLHSILEALHVDGVVDEGIAVIEESLQFVHADGLELDAGEDQLVLGVVRHIFLVPANNRKKEIAQNTRLLWT